MKKQKLISYEHDGRDQCEKTMILHGEITKIDRKEGTDKIASIDIPQLNLLSVDQVEGKRFICRRC